MDSRGGRASQSDLMEDAEPACSQHRTSANSQHNLTLLSRSPTLEAIKDTPVVVRNRASGDAGLARPQSPPSSLTTPLLTSTANALDATNPMERERRPPVLEAQLHIAYTLSWIVNILLFSAKAAAWWLSGSSAVLASLVDSIVDLLSQAIIFIAEWRSKKADPRFPVGKARLETIGVLGCACIMSVSTMQVIQAAGVSLYDGLADGNLPQLDAGVIMYSVLGGATVLKLICYVMCVALQKHSDSMLALAEDHLNDVMSNVAAAATVAVATLVSGAWWVDPAGGIAISLFILWRWYEIAKNQVDKIVGRGAPDELLVQLRQVAEAHHDRLEVDCLRAYHFGAKYMVEAEVVMPIEYTLREVHDISLELQIRLEAIPLVERAFVHVDYQKRDQPEHRTERLLAGLPVLEEEPLEALACLSPHGSANAGTPPPTQRKDSNEGGSNGGDMV